ncbi:hypothetical protein Tco_0170982 [Tanacetum coccineum]
MSSMGELTFFLGLQVTQKDDGIFISQDKYVDEILKKFRFSIVKTASTPMETSKSLMKDENAKDVDVHLDRSMIGSLMYLTSSRPDNVCCQWKRISDKRTKKSSKNGQNQAQNGKAWKRQSRIEVTVKVKSQMSKTES